MIDLINIKLFMQYYANINMVKKKIYYLFRLNDLILIKENIT